MLVSGDVHFGLISQTKCGNVTISEVTSSGLTHSARDLFPQLNGPVASFVNGLFFGDQLEKNGYAGRHFAELEIDLTGKAEPVVMSRLISLHPDESHGTVVLEHRLDSMSNGMALGNATCLPIGAARDIDRACKLMSCTTVFVGLGILVCCCLGCWKKEANDDVKSHQD